MTMILSLTQRKDANQPDEQLVSLVGGKAASLMKLYSIPELSQHVPSGFALTVDFFADWVDAVLESKPYQEALTKLNDATTTSANQDTKELAQLCDRVKEYCQTLNLNDQQQTTLDRISQDMEKSWNLPLAAVRSSAPEEDGTGASFAGAFETVLGVSRDGLVDAVRKCFASLWDYRVFSYMSNNSHSNGTNHKPAFAAVVMEMVDSHTAGVAFSVNPINSDLDELVVDCSYGLGESVVDGSVVADRYIYNKFDQKMVEVSVGSKKQEKRLDTTGEGGSTMQPVDEERQKVRTLSDQQLQHLCHLVALIEEAYSLPMDVEFAFAERRKGEGNKNGSNDDLDLELKLLQARPITTTFTLDQNMITPPSEPRKLYYDFNVASEATTTEPFTHLDLELYSKMCAIMFATPNADNLFPNDPTRMFFNASTRQYINCSLAFRWISPQTMSKSMELLDPYLASIFDSSDCDAKKYISKKGAKEMTISNAIWLLREVPMWTIYKKSRKYTNRPEQAKIEYKRILKECEAKLEEVRCRGVVQGEGGLKQHIQDLLQAMMPSFLEELAFAFVMLSTFGNLDQQRREGKTKEIREEYEALCGGYEGDPLMEQNIAMYKLAQSLPMSIWSQYDHSTFDQLAKRIQANLDGDDNDLPKEFLDNWKSFMKRFGYDGTPQLFVSSPRYVDHPEILLAKICHSAGDAVKDPTLHLQAKVTQRREAMTKQEERARKSWNPWALSKVKTQNATLEQIMWMRNCPKIHFANIMGMAREAVVAAESELIRAGRLEKQGDIFHLGVEEIDQALLLLKGEESSSADLKELVKPRRARYEQAKRAKVCPMLIDSRNRILRPDVNKKGENSQPGTLVGAAISPGVATGRVRIVNDPTEPFETGEVLATVVTDPAWTPLFVGASAVIFQIGGVLQHGALCAREYGKPGVSGIEIHSHLKDGMMVSVDGNTGVVTILEEDENKAQ